MGEDDPVLRVWVSVSFQGRSAVEKLWIFCRIFSMNLIDESTILSMIDDSSDLFVNLTNILIEPWIPENL